MKHLICSLIFSAALVFAADTPAEKLPEGVPAGSTKVAGSTYRFVDKEGKAWLYRHTPFGYQRRAEEEKSEPAAADSDGSRMTPFGRTKGEPERLGSAPAAPRVDTKAREEGDTIHFERPSPFGVYKWSRKKDELTREEQKIWESQQRKPAAAGNDSK
jgi:hypothetical protein